MDRLAGHRKKTHSKKKKQIKVVYISNPMKVKASASEFRALVQELTGQDSDPAEMAKLGFDDTTFEPYLGDHHHHHHHHHHHAALPPVVNDRPLPPAPQSHYRPSMPAPPVLPLIGTSEPLSRSDVTIANPFDDGSSLLDDVFTPQMLESFNGFFPSSISYESQLDLLRSLDAV